MVMDDGFWIAGGTGRAGLLDSGWMSERLIASKVENILAGFPSLHLKGSFFIICWIESLSDHQPWSSKLRENLLPFSLSTPRDLPHTWHDFVHARAKTWIGSSTLHCAMPPGRVFQFYQSNLGVYRKHLSLNRCRIIVNFYLACWMPINPESQHPDGWCTQILAQLLES